MDTRRLAVRAAPRLKVLLVEDEARIAQFAVSSILYLVAPSFAGIMAARFVDDTGKAAFRPTWGTLMAAVARSPGAGRGRAVGNVDALLSVGCSCPAPGPGVQWGVPPQPPPGLRGLLGTDDFWQFTARTMTATTAMILTQQAFEEVVGQSPALQARIASLRDRMQRQQPLRRGGQVTWRLGDRHRAQEDRSV